MIVEKVVEKRILGDFDDRCEALAEISTKKQLIDVSDF
jgi:hypothetical protein